MLASIGTVRDPLTSIRLATVKIKHEGTDVSQDVVDWRSGALGYCGCGGKMGQLLWETGKVPHKSQHGLTGVIQQLHFRAYTPKR